MKNKSRERANEIIQIYVDGLDKFKFLKSVVLVGSLSDNTYTEGPSSDIDFVHIVDENYYLEAKKEISDYIEYVEKLTNNDIHIAKVVYAYESLFHPYNYDFELNIENRDNIEMPIEILRIKDSGKVIYGEDIIEKIENPTKKDILISDKLEAMLLEALKEKDPLWYENYKETKQNPPIGILVQIVITSAMKDYFLITGKNCSSKFRILECIENDIPSFEYLELLRLCHKWRFNKESITKSDLLKMEKEYKSSYLKSKKR